MSALWRNGNPDSGVMGLTMVRIHGEVRSKVEIKKDTWFMQCQESLLVLNKMSGNI